MQAKGKKAARKAGSDSEEEDMDVSDESDGEWAQPAKPKVAALLFILSLSVYHRISK